MAEESKLGQMALNTRAIGKMIKLISEESFIMLMEIFTKENGLMIKHMAMVFIDIQMVLFLKDFGKMISKMVKERKCGQMVLVTLELTEKGKRAERVNSDGRIALNMTENFLIIIFMERVFK